MRRDRGSRKLCLLLMPLVLVALLAAVGLGATGCGPDGPRMDRVSLDSGPITGSSKDGIWTYLGIPYAEPPIGDLRWKPPQPVASWKDARACTTYGPACPQPASVEMAALSPGDTSEDCLYLNVWSPASDPTERMPVMVWIHGGSFITGSGSMPVYEGRNLAGKGVVVVTINYRLGALGFLAHPLLSQESPDGVSGNYGLLDQIAALQWVKRNIAGFGGDPERVTVFGESAGAISILDLMVSPAAKGLFQRAIAQSGILLDAALGNITSLPLYEAESRGEDLAKALGCASASDVLAAMRGKTVDEVLAAAPRPGLLTEGLSFCPVVDRVVLPDDPTRLWSEGAQLDVPLIVGSNADEGNAFLSQMGMSLSRYETDMSELFGPFAPKILERYPAASDEEVVMSLSRMLTEVGFASTARFAASSMSSEGKASKAYLYQFTRVPLRNPLGAFHGVEIPYVFGNAGLFAGVEAVDTELSAKMMAYWARFAAAGDPNGEDGVVWPSYDPTRDEHLELGDTVRVGSGLFKEACDLADLVRASR